MLESIFLDLFVGALMFMVGQLYANRKLAKIYLQSISRRNKEVRLSCAYLYRIMIGNKYLLIKGNKIDQLQPVGGVYKYYPSFKKNMEQMKIRTESDKRFYDKGDLRLRIKGLYLPKFIHWFDSRQNREVGSYREFYEELIVTGILGYETLSKIEIEFLYQVKEPIKFSTHFQVDEQKIFDIYELRIPEELCNPLNDDKRVRLVDADEINAECCNIENKSRKIAMTAKYIL